MKNTRRGTENIVTTTATKKTFYLERPVDLAKGKINRLTASTRNLVAQVMIFKKCYSKQYGLFIWFTGT